MVAPDVGGGFGSKLNVYAEEILAVANIARRLEVPIKFVEDRTENYHGDHPRARPDPGHRARRHERGQDPRA